MLKYSIFENKIQRRYNYLDDFHNCLNQNELEILNEMLLILTKEYV